MLAKYAFSNFQSFRSPTEVSLTLNERVPDSAWSNRTSTGARISKVMAVIGPNASGKTGLLKPLAFVHWFIAHSFNQDPQGLLPFFPHPSIANEPSDFEAEMEIDGKLYRYVLRATREQVLHESLYVKKLRMNYIFVRDYDQKTQSYTVKQQDFGFNQAEATKVRANASLISTAAQYGVALALRLAQMSVFSNIHQFGRVILDDQQLLSAANYFSTNEQLRQRMVALLSAWDMGLSDVLIKSLETIQPDNTRQIQFRPIGVHRLQNGASFELEFVQESSGTQGAFILLAKLLPTLQTGGLAIIDEFENDLHPHMLSPILDLFASPVTNPKNAQLIFTCHALEVLNILHKSQVTLVEKDENNESEAWRLDEVDGIRNDDNLYAKYMAGAYGAIPQL